MRYFLRVLVAIVILGIGVVVWQQIFRKRESLPADNSKPETVSQSASKTVSEPAFVLPQGVRISFANVAESAGIKFQHVDGRTEMEYLTDSTGPGVAWLDFDQDGLMDLFLVQGYPVLPPFPADQPGCQFYRNLGGGRFENVTTAVGCGHVGCGQGAAVGDFDNDGFPDLFLTCFGKPNVLWRNVPDGKGGRRFEDVTVRAGLSEHPDWKTRPNWSTSAAFLDLDNDGRLDLFVCGYVKVDLSKYPECRQAASGRRAACPPQRFPGTTCVLYRNLGDGKFAEVSASTGIDQPNAKALGVVALDLDDDGRVDLFVANDGVPNFLFRNLGGGKFERRGPASGCAVNGAGNPQAYMGVVAADLDGDGRPDLFSTAFAREANSLFRNLGGCRFLDVTAGSGLGPPSWHRLGFGTVALDVDRDGSLDLVVANGHVMAHIDLDGDPNNTFRQPPQLFLNDGRGHFHEITATAGPAFQKQYVGRGLATADYDNDGRIDLCLADSGGPVALWHNDSVTPNNWLRFELRGVKSNRDAVGAKVTFKIGDRSLVRHREGGGSYLSAHDPRLLVGLGTAGKVDQLEIRWPSGLVQAVGPLEANKGYRVTEGSAEIETRP